MPRKPQRAPDGTEDHGGIASGLVPLVRLLARAAAAEQISSQERACRGDNEGGLDDEED